jgi:hypothetical protein
MTDATPAMSQTSSHETGAPAAAGPVKNVSVMIATAPASTATGRATQLYPASLPRAAAARWSARRGGAGGA